MFRVDVHPERPHKYQVYREGKGALLVALKEKEAKALLSSLSMFFPTREAKLTCGQALELARHLLDAVGHNVPEGTDDVNAPLGRTVMVLGAMWLVTRRLYEGDNGRHVYVMESDCGRTMRLDPHALARLPMLE